MDHHLHEHDWDCLGFLHQRCHGRCGHADDQVGLQFDYLLANLRIWSGASVPQRKSRRILCPSVHPSAAQPLSERAYARLCFRIALGEPAQHSYAPRSLRELAFGTVRRERTRSCAN